MAVAVASIAHGEDAVRKGIAEIPVDQGPDGLVFGRQLLPPRFRVDGAGEAEMDMTVYQRRHKGAVG